MARGSAHLGWSAVGPAALLVALLFAQDASGQCVCDGGEGLFTTHTGVTADGSFADWAAVHGDPDDNVCDGPTGGLLDRDAPVQSTGRDIDHFAFTWDDTNVYLYTRRVGSTNNVQRFVYYADTNNDGLLQTGERVIGVNWNGNTRLIEVYLFEYAAVAGGGEPTPKPSSPYSAVTALRQSRGAHWHGDGQRPDHHPPVRPAAARFRAQ